MRGGVTSAVRCGGVAVLLGVWWCLMVRMTLRLPDDLYELLRDAAFVEQRSLSGEIVVRLRRALAGGGGDGFGASVASPASALNGGGLAEGTDAGRPGEAAASRSGQGSLDGTAGSRPSASSSRVVPARSAARTVVCEHRIPPAGFCKVCDGG
jgi:hypothetical protein